MMCCYIQECLQLASKTQHLIQLTCDGSHLEKKKNPGVGGKPQDFLGADELVIFYCML